MTRDPDDESAVPPPANIAALTCIICLNAMSIWGRCCCLEQFALLPATHGQPARGD